MYFNRMFAKCKCASIIVWTKLVNSSHSGLVREMVGVKKFTCLSLSIIRCSDDLLAPKRFNFMVLNEKQVPDKFKQPFPSYPLEALGIRCSSSFLLFSQDNSQVIYFDWDQTRRNVFKFGLLGLILV